MAEFVKKVCKHCGSEDIAFDAWAVWDYVTQQWGLQSTFDATHCNSCGGESSTRDVQLEGDELAEAKAYKLAIDNGWAEDCTAIEFCDAMGLNYQEG